MLWVQNLFRWQLFFVLPRVGRREWIEYEGYLVYVSFLSSTLNTITGGGSTSFTISTFFL